MMSARLLADNHTPRTVDDRRLQQLGRKVIAVEQAALAALADRIDASFAGACRHLLACEGRVVVIGMGKSGHIASKIAATFASTGTPAFFVHPGEASHGDMGMITSKDVVVALSNSGETGELLVLIPLIKRLGVPLIALTGNVASNLAQAASVHLDVSVEQEACPLNLAPTASTTVALAMGDALAIALLEARGFSAEDFALAHPGGSLGRRLLLRIVDIMRTGTEIPYVGVDALLKDALMEMSRKGLGMTAILTAEGAIAGIFTDGDLRRALDKGVDVHRAGVADVMTVKCTTIAPEALAVEALNIMQGRKINALLVVAADNALVGVLNMHDLLRAGVM
jgi:arabinose-5-phosphate isomerase